MRILAAMLLMVALVRAEEPAPEGLPVSRPLQPVSLPEEPPPPPPVDPPAEVPPPVIEEEGPSRTLMPRSWASYELPLWWSKAQPMPALVTGSTGLAPPVLGGANTQVLVGGSAICDSVSAGFRFTWGWANGAGAGWEFGGLFLGTKVRSTSFADTEQGRFTAIGQPYIDAFNGQPGVLLVSGDAVGPGAVQVATTTRVQGWEINGVKNIVECGEVAVTAVGGYRYFGANEGLHIQQSSLRIGPGGVPSELWGVYDQFDARNNYHGGQIGLRVDAIHGDWLLSFSGMCAFGTNFETVIVSGGSSRTTAALPLPQVQRFNAGMLAVGSNSGRNMESRFAVLPEARVNLGVRVGGNSHFFVGYDFLYLSDAVRPGDQVDLTVDPARSPFLNDQRVPAPVTRPRQPFNRSDFWVQGLVLGLDCRY